ncbi:MAG TPA: PKD domain-containing protein [Thermoanaerobaculia bacterium]|nr:PKD domain-containing protein [Thermoanaerobaculia bacterium]
MRGCTLAAILFSLIPAALFAQAPPPEAEELREACPEDHIAEYLERHGDYGKIDPEIMLELSRRVKASLDAQRFVASSIGGTVWKSIGPTNGAGRATAIALHPGAPDTAIIGAAGGGAWKTTDGGTNWRALTDDIPNLSVGAIAYAPSDPRVVYLGTGEGGYAGDFIPGIGLLVSNDGGESWTLPSSVIASQFYKILVSPTNPQELLAATNNGLLRSTTGQNGPWTQVIRSLAGPQTGYGDVTDLVRDPTDANMLYAATWDRRLWCVKQRCGIETSFASPTVMKSTDGGATWSPASTGLPASTASQRVNRMAMAIAPSSPQTLYLATSILDNATGDEGSHIYKSTDGAATWTETALPGSKDFGVSQYLGTQGWYDNTIIVSPADPNVVIAGGIGYIKTIDGGGSWTRTMTTVHVDAHELRYDAAGTLWIACDGGIWTSADSTTATGHNNGLVTRQFYDIANDPANRNRVYGGQQDNGTILRGDAGGSSWTNFSGGDGFACAVNRALPAVAYSTVQFGIVLRTVTAGTINRTIQRTPPYEKFETTPFYSIVMVDPKQPSTLYSVSNRIWKSTTSGDGWQPLPSVLVDGQPLPTDASIRTFAISPSDPNVMMIALASPRRHVYRTTNGGAQWTDVTGTLPAGRTILHLEIDPGDPRHVFAAIAGTSGPSMYMSADGGSTWQERTNGLPPFSAQTVRFDPTDSTTLYAGTDVGVYRSTDSGGSWQRFGTGMPAVSVYDVEPLADGTILRAATHGRGVWELDIGAPPNVPPSITIITPATQQIAVSPGTSVSFNGAFSDPNSDVTTAIWTFADDWSSVPATSGGSVSHRFDRIGRYPVGLAVRDSNGGIGAASVEVDVLDPADSCSTPIEIPSAGPFPYSLTINTDLSTKQASDPHGLSACYSFNPVSSTWVTFTPEVSGDYQVSLCGSSVSAIVIGYTGDACGALTPMNLCISRPSTTSDCASSLSTQAGTLTAGVPIRMLVSNYFANDYGEVTLTITQNTTLAPLVTRVAPATGAAGTQIAINGVGFQSGATVTIGGVRAENVVFVSTNLLLATVGARGGGNAEVTVQNPDGTVATLGAGFTYAPVPTGRRRAVRR